MPIRTIETNGDTLLVTVSEDVRPSDLGELAEALQREPRPGRTRFDFRDARECTPSSLVTLATLLSQLGMSYEFAGLSSSNCRVLEYLEALGTTATSGIEPPGGEPG